MKRLPKHTRATLFPRRMGGQHSIMGGSGCRVNKSGLWNLVTQAWSHVIIRCKFGVFVTECGVTSHRRHKGAEQVAHGDHHLHLGKRGRRAIWEGRGEGKDGR
jgi:hypothetical protein